MSQRFVAALVVTAAVGCAEPRELGCCAIDERFEWGSATAAFQIEGDNRTSDWAQWEARCVLDEVNGVRDAGETVTDCESNLDGPDGWTHFDADFAAAAAMGHNAVRLGLEWAKLEPAPGVYDGAVIAHYRAVLRSARAHGLTPMVTLQHFTLPIWVHDLEVAPHGLGGWAGYPGQAPGEAGIVDAFARFAGAMAIELGDQVDLWVTINEPIVMVLAGYMVGAFPPGATLKPETTLRAAFTMAHAHARAYDALHRADLVDADGDGVAAAVSIAKHWRILDPVDPDNPRCVASAARQDLLFNHLFLQALTAGRVDLNADGDLEEPGEGVDPSLAGRLDWLGINYYGRMMVYDSLATLCDDPACPPGAGVELALLTLENDDPGVPRSELGWEIYPEGFTRALVAASAYGLPIRVTENGVADADDDQRPAFLVSHVTALQAAMARGVDVRGYYHWSLVDNFEWAEGYAPRFGLWAVDYAAAERTRTARPSATAFSEIIAAGGVNRALRRTWGTLGE